MHGLEDGEYVVSSLSGKVSDTPYGLKGGIYEMPEGDIAMSQISTGFQLKSEGSAHSTLDSYAEESLLPTKFTPSTLPISMGYQGSLGESARPQLSSNSDAKDNYLPTRFAPSISDLGMVGATALIIYFANHLRRKFWRNKESKEEERVSTVKDIENKLSSICDENIVFNNKELKLEFAGLSEKLKDNIKNFFRDKDSFEIKENPNNRKLILQLKKDLLPEKIEKIIATLIEFEDKFRNDFNAEKTTMAEKEEDEKIIREKEQKMKELKILIQNKFLETEQKIDKINAIFEEKNDKEISDKEKNLKKIEKKIYEVKKCFSTLNAFQQEFKDNFDHNYSMEKENIELGKKLVEIEDKKTLEIVQEEASKYFADNPEVKLHNKKEVLKESEMKDDFIVEEEIKEVIQPSASVELLKIQDLIILELFLLGRFQVNKIANQIQGHNSGKLNFYQMGFANDLAKINLNDFDAEFNSPQSVESFNKYAKSFDPPIVRNPENLAKNYFHNLLKETVETIYQKESVQGEGARFKRDIESRIYFFLDYAMGDKEAMLTSYQEKEIKGYSRAGLTGRGHASKANIDDLKKLCYCLKLFKNQLINVNNQELKDFFTNAFVKPSSIDSSFSVSVINSREEIVKSDAFFVKDLIQELNRDEDKIKGIDGAKNIIINFFRQNAISNIGKISNVDLKEKFSEIIALSDSEVLKYLQKNSDLVDEIVSLSKSHESKLSFNELRKDLQSLYEKEKMAVVERESKKIQSSSQR
jgi:hypothetical protein